MPHGRKEPESESLLLNDDKQKNKDEEINQIEKINESKEIAKGIVAAALFAFVIALSRICVQALQEKIPHLQLNAMRCALPGNNNMHSLNECL